MENNIAKIVIADLYLHYFSWQETTKIVNKIKSILMDDGHLLCRVNSIKDINYGAGSCEEQWG